MTTRPVPDARENPRPVDGLAAETERGWDSKANLPKRLDRYAKAKERALTMRDYIARVVRQDPWTRSVAHELHLCGSYLVFRSYDDQDRVRLRAMQSCRQHLLCPLCAIRRGAKMLARYLERVELVLQGDRSLRAHMVTLTVRNGADLEERYAHLHRSLKRFHKRRHLGRGSEAEKIRGAVWSYEFKRGTGSGLWHPHVHCVWLCSQDAPPSHAALSEEWREVTGDSFIVETHPLHGALVDGFAEVFKYAVKFGDLPVSDNWDGFVLLRGRRLIGSSGALWGVQVPETLTDDELADGGRWVDLFFRFMRGNGYVQQGYAGHSIEEQAA